MLLACSLQLCFLLLVQMSTYWQVITGILFPNIISFFWGCCYWFFSDMTFSSSAMGKYLEKSISFSSVFRWVSSGLPHLHIFMFYKFFPPHFLIKPLFSQGLHFFLIVSPYYFCSGLIFFSLKKNAALTLIHFKIIINFISFLIC